MADFGQTDFGQTEFDWCVVLCCVVCCLCGVGTCFTVSWSGVSCVGVGFKVWFGPPFLGQSFPGTALPLDRPKFRPFFFPSRRKFLSLSLSLGVFSLNFGGVFEGRDPHMCTSGALW